MAPSPSSAKPYSERHRHDSYSSIHHTRHHHRPDHTRIYEPDRSWSSPKTSLVRDTWPYLEAVMKYPYATGTSVLDLARYPIPVTGASHCVYPMVRMIRLTTEGM